MRHMSLFGRSLPWTCALHCWVVRGQAIKTVFSHFVQIKHHAEWLKARHPRARLHAVASTALAAQKAAESNQAAALASPGAAEVYGLDVLELPEAGQTVNVTHFFVIGAEARFSRRIAKDRPCRGPSECLRQSAPILGTLCAAESQSFPDRFASRAGSSADLCFFPGDRRQPSSCGSRPDADAGGCSGRVDDEPRRISGAQTL